MTLQLADILGISLEALKGAIANDQVSNQSIYLYVEGFLPLVLYTFDVYNNIIIIYNNILLLLLFLLLFLFIHIKQLELCWATALAIVFLEKECSQNKGEWDLIHKKAVRYLKQKKQLELIKLAKQLWPKLR